MSEFCIEKSLSFVSPYRLAVQSEVSVQDFYDFQVDYAQYWHLMPQHCFDLLLLKYFSAAVSEAGTLTVAAPIGVNGNVVCCPSLMTE